MTLSLIGLVGVIVVISLIFTDAVPPAALNSLILTAALLLWSTILGGMCSLFAVVFRRNASALVALVISIVSVIASFCNLAFVYLVAWAYACA